MASDPNGKRDESFVNRPFHREWPAFQACSSSAALVTGQSTAHPAGILCGLLIYKPRFGLMVPEAFTASTQFARAVILEAAIPAGMQFRAFSWLRMCGGSVATA
jgi:hypothetical protein